MSVTFELFAGANAALARLINVKDGATGEPLNTATVTLVDIRDNADAVLGGVAWPLNMPNTGPGEYSAIVPASAAVVAKVAYTANITATAPGGLDGEWSPTTIAKVRTGC